MADRGSQGSSKKDRKQLGKQERERRLREMKRARQMRSVRNVVIALVLIGAVVFAVLALSHKTKVNSAKIDSLAAAAGCSPMETPVDLGRGHFESAKESITYNSNPPTSGKHDPQWANTGVTDTPIPDRNQVHNLEHGHIGLQYTTLPPALKKALIAYVKTDPTRIFLAPRPNLDEPFAITAWDHLIKCAHPNDQLIPLIKSFHDQFAGKGPEGDIPGTPVGA